MQIENRPALLRRVCTATYDGIIQLFKAALTTEGRITPTTEKHAKDWVQRDQATHWAKFLMFGRK